MQLESWKAVLGGVTHGTASQGPLGEPLLRVPEQAMGHSALGLPLLLSVQGEYMGFYPPPTPLLPFMPRSSEISE